MAVYNCGDFKKGIKVQIDGDPFLMIECNFVKPGKGQGLYKCKLKNLVRGTTLERVYRSGDQLDVADIEEIDAQFLYKQGDMYCFMENTAFEQYELTQDQVGDGAQFLKEGMNVSMVLFDNKPITVTPPNHVVLRVTYCEPSARGDTATNVTKPATTETGAIIHCPAFVNQDDLIRVDTRTGEYIERVKE